MIPQHGALCYLGSPYSLYPGGPHEAFEDVSRIAAKLLRAGVKVYSPISHTHPLAIYGDLDPLDLSIWLPFDEAMMQACHVLIVAHMPGWQESKGIAHEVAYFERAGKAIFDLDPVSLVMTKRKPVVVGDQMTKAVV